MDKLKHILLLVLLMASRQSTIAQNSSSNGNHNISIDETVFIHSNATTFVTGETLYYKLYCLNATNKTPSTISKVAYVELIDSNKGNVFKNKLFLENTTGQGDFFVPTTLKTGNYKLIGYTNWMLNKPVSEIFQMDIVVINPFQSNDGKSIITIPNAIDSKNKTKPDSHKSSTKNSIENQNLKFKLSKKTFSNREQIILKIESLTQIPIKGNFSLAVRKLDDLPSEKQITTTEFAEKIPGTIVDFQNSEKKLILPELRGEMISGRITSKNNSNEVQNVTIALSIPGKSFAFKVIKTNLSGNFIFNLEKAYYNSNVVIQIMDDNRDNYTITLDNIPGIDYSKVSIQPDFNLTPELKESILNRSVMSQIENAYYHKKTDSIIKIEDYNSFFYPTAKEYILDNYTRFPSLKETITEVTKEIYYQQKDKNYSLHVSNYNIFPQLPEPALVLIDGLLLQDTNELFEYKMKNISKISIISGLYYLGPKAFNSVISFTTKNQDFISKQSGSYILDASVLRPSLKKKYFTPDYMDNSKNGRIPDYRYQLLWLPQLTLASNENPISFYTSDVTGTFEITLEGFTDQGIPISIKNTFEVQ